MDRRQAQHQNPSPHDLEGDDKVEVEVQYENIPYSECLSAGHLIAKCPFTFKHGILRAPASASIETQGNARNQASTIVIDGELSQLPTFPSDALVNPADSWEVTVTTEAASDVNTEKVGNQGLSSASLLEVVTQW
ncbi:hypothetical protein MRB53_013778 [Persea americana]|uniref:Uncharacterized protein n=1 Tax=Persea americana TaxID=3435 RepID=A0ACC2K907_PERAE|nr:hypothetical protein MRB53_013778 [Persea americana]